VLTQLLGLCDPHGESVETSVAGYLIPVPSSTPKGHLAWWESVRETFQRGSGRPWRYPGLRYPEPTPFEASRSNMKFSRTDQTLCQPKISSCITDACARQTPDHDSLLHLDEKHPFHIACAGRWVELSATWYVMRTPCCVAHSLHATYLRMRRWHRFRHARMYANLDKCHMPSEFTASVSARRRAVVGMGPAIADG